MQSYHMPYDSTYFVDAIHIHHLIDETMPQNMGERNLSVSADRFRDGGDSR